MAERMQVVRNEDGAMSTWRLGRGLPNGWTPTAFVGDRDECAREIERAWAGPALGLVDSAAAGDDHGDLDLHPPEKRLAEWSRLAAAGACVWSRPGSSPSGFWSVFSHEDARAVLAPKAPFTSEYGMMIGFDQGHPDAAGGSMLVVTDGAEHAKLRKLIGPFMSRLREPQLLAGVRREVRDALRAARKAAVTDVARTLGPRVPAAAVCGILGVPLRSRERMIALTNHAFGGDDPDFAEMTPLEAHVEMLDFFGELAAQRAREPREDLVSALVGDGSLGHDEVVRNCDNVLIGGNETTRHALTGVFHAIALDPTILEHVRRDPDDIDSVVDELVRWTSPAAHVLRVATSDTTIGIQRINAGDAVVVWLPSANRDPNVYEHPDRVVPGRAGPKHLGFGTGMHHCLGAAVARMEIAELLRELALRVESVELAEPPVLLRSAIVHGYRSLRVAITWKQARA